MNLIYLTSVIFAIYLINQADSVSKPQNGRLVCGFNETGVVKPPATSRLKKDFEHPVRYLQVYIVVDYAAYKSMYFNGSELTVQLIMQVMMTACNELFKPLNLHLVVTGLDIQKVKSSVPKKIFTPEHFEAVKEYTAKRYDKKDYEVLVYLSGYTFLDDVGGIATWRQICRPNNVILVRNMGLRNDC
ncbi:hypothetical protein HDE_06130 [Halotydeus destructor]|nr:hypothetical protein HDE_06130 [Halotydeus destructor]